MGGIDFIVVVQVFYSLSLYDTPRFSSAAPGVGPTGLRYDRHSILGFVGV